MIATFEDEPLPRAVLRQRDRALPRRRAHLDAVPLRGAAVGDPERADRLRPLPGRLQHQRDDARGQGQADPLAQPPRGRRGLALRQGPLRVPAPLRGRPDRRAARARAPPRLRASSPGTTRSTAPRRCCAARRAASSRRSPARRRSSRPTRSASCCAAGSARTRRCCPRRPRPRSTRSARRSRRSRDAELVVVVGDERGRRPRAGRRPLAQGAARGAEIVRRGRRGTCRRSRQRCGAHGAPAASSACCAPPSARS